MPMPITAALVNGTMPQKIQQAGLIELRFRAVEVLVQNLQSDFGGETPTGASTIFSDDLPLAVASTPSAGTDNKASRGRHVHRGVGSITKSAAAVGSVVLAGGVSQALNVFTFIGMWVDHIINEGTRWDTAAASDLPLLALAGPAVSADILERGFHGGAYPAGATLQNDFFVAAGTVGGGPGDDSTIILYVVGGLDISTITIPPATALAIVAGSAPLNIPAGRARLGVRVDVPAGVTLTITALTFLRWAAAL